MELFKKKRKAGKRGLSIFKSFKKAKKIWSRKKKIRRDELKEGALKKLKKIKSNKLNPNSIEGLNRIFRIYLREKYKIKESLTLEEITPYLKEKKVKREKTSPIIYILTKINSYEYLQEKFTRKDFEKLIDEIVKLIKEQL